MSRFQRIFAGFLGLLAAACAQSYNLPPVVDCGSASQANDIAMRYPLNATGVLNGTIAFLPIPLSLARSIIPAKYQILEAAYRELMPNFPSGHYPALLQAMHDHDVRFGSIKMNDFQRASIEFPFVDLLGDGSTSFRWGSAIFITNTNQIGIDAIAEYGATGLPSAFEPSCNAFNPVGPDAYDYNASAVNNTANCEGGKPCLRTFFSHDNTPLDRDFMKFLVNATNQPFFGNGKVCANQIRLFDEPHASSSSPWALRPVQGRAYAVGAVGAQSGHEGHILDFPSIKGVFAPCRFIENNYIPCEQLRGYGGHSADELLAWVPPASSPSATQATMRSEEPASLEDSFTVNGTETAPEYSPALPGFITLLRRYMMTPANFVSG